MVPLLVVSSEDSVMRFLALVLVLTFGLVKGYAAEAAKAPVKDVASVVVEDKAPIVTLRESVLSDYVFRGQLRNDDPISQTEVGINKGAFSLNFCGITDLTANASDNELNVTEFRIDAGLHKVVYSNAASKLLSSVELFGGAIYYSFPESKREATTEVYGGVDTTSAFGIHTRTTAYYDIDEVGGGYLQTKVYRPINVPVKFNVGKQSFKTTLYPEAALGWGSKDYDEYYWNDKNSAFTDVSVSVKLLFESKSFEFGPSVTYTDLIDSKVQAAQDEDSSKWIYGLLFGVKF